MKHHLIILTIFLSLNLYAGSYEKGKALYKEKACGGCHGAKLEGINMYPYLANRSKGFLIYKLKRFRSQISDNQQQEMMIPFAMELSDENIEHLATYMYNYIEEESNNKSYDDSFEVHGDGGS